MRALLEQTLQETKIVSHTHPPFMVRLTGKQSRRFIDCWTAALSFLRVDLLFPILVMKP